MLDLGSSEQQAFPTCRGDGVCLSGQVVCTSTRGFLAQVKACESIFARTRRLDGVCWRRTASGTLYCVATTIYFLQEAGRTAASFPRLLSSLQK